MIMRVIEGRLAKWVQYSPISQAANDWVDYSRMDNCARAILDCTDDLLTSLLGLRAVARAGLLDNEYLAGQDKRICMEMDFLDDLFDQIDNHRRVHHLKRIAPYTNEQLRLHAEAADLLDGDKPCR